MRRTRLRKEIALLTERAERSSWHISVVVSGAGTTYIRTRQRNREPPKAVKKVESNNGKKFTLLSGGIAGDWRWAVTVKIKDDFTLLYSLGTHQTGKEKKVTWNRSHKETNRISSQKWAKSNREKARAAVAKCVKANPAIQLRKESKRRGLGFEPLNKRFKGGDAHHIDKKRVVYIPRELHQSVAHNVFSGKNMEKINALTLEWLNSSEM